MCCYHEEHCIGCFRGWKEMETKRRYTKYLTKELSKLSREKRDRIVHHRKDALLSWQRDRISKLVAQLQKLKARVQELEEGEKGYLFGKKIKLFAPSLVSYAPLYSLLIVPLPRWVTSASYSWCSYRFDFQTLPLLGVPMPLEG
jgi:hypothetical protein